LMGLSGVMERFGQFGCASTFVMRLRLYAGGVDYSSYLFYLAEEMKRGELLGSLEHIILLALVRLDGSAHGMIVRREIEQRTGRNISIGAVYATLERLEAKRYVSSSTGDPTPERGGRAKRLFRVEAAGNRALQISEQTLQSMTADSKRRWEPI
jgi:PadR family transcriptional regulator PadR